MQIVLLPWATIESKNSCFLLCGNNLRPSFRQRYLKKKETLTYKERQRAYRLIIQILSGMIRKTSHRIAKIRYCGGFRLKFR